MIITASSKRLVFFAAAALACRWLSGAEPTIPTFSAPYDYQSFAYHFVVADVNGDGIPDILAYDTGGAAIRVDLGNGDGTFRAGPTSTEPLNGFGVATGDFNGDGILDVLVAGMTCCSGKTENAIGVMFGNGDGTFSTGPITALPKAAQKHEILYAAVADFNNDGNTDVVLAFGYELLFLPGDGNGAFGNSIASTQSTSFPGIDMLVASDFNQDGNPDIATVINYGKEVGVFLGNGAGSFTLKSTPITPYASPSFGLAAGDVNGDGKPDLVGEGFSAGGSDGYTQVAIGNGDGTFQKTTYLALEGDGVAIADVNGDGIPDLVTDYVGIALGEGGGSFAKATYLPIDGIVTPVVTSLRNDGIKDIVVDSYGAALVLLGEGGGKFAPYPTVSLAATAGQMVSAGFTGGGYPDIALVESTPAITVLKGTGKAKLPLITGPSTPLPEAGDIAEGDFNNDGIPDLAFSGGGPTGGSVGIYLGSGSGTFTAQTPVTTSSASYLCVGDFNGDGNLDVASGYGVVNYGNGSGGLSAPLQLEAPYSIVQCAAGDLNNDGIADIAVASVLNGVGYVYLGGKNGFSSPIALNAGNGLMFLADVNNDGNLDLIQAFTGGISIQLGNGDGTFRSTQGVVDENLGIPSSIVIADFNGDGNPDIAIGDTGDEYVIIYTGNGDGTFQDAEIIAPAKPFGYLLAMDLHGQRASQGVKDLVYGDGSALGYIINETK